MVIRVQEAASLRLDESYRYTGDTWGEAQAETYITGLFAAFEQIETHGVHSRAVPAEFGVEGYFFRDERHFVYWRHLSNADTGIVTILHERRTQIGRVQEDFFRLGSASGVARTFFQDLALATAMADKMTVVCSCSDLSLFRRQRKYAYARVLSRTSLDSPISEWIPVTRSSVVFERSARPAITTRSSPLRPSV